ncbi:MAG: hypothetical protein RLY78_3599, partial [Pseudomonadota bacterium]
GGGGGAPGGGPPPPRPDDPRAAAAARTARRPLETVDLPLDLPVMPQTAAAPPGRADRPVRARAEGPAVPPTTAAAPGPEVGRQAATTPVATARGGATPTPTPPPHWRPPPRANDSRFDSRWNSSLLDSRWLNLSVRASDATPHDRRRPAAPVLPFHRRQPGAWSLAAAGQGVQPTLEPRWDEGPARSDAGPQTLPLRRAGATQRRQPPR